MAPTQCSDRDYLLSLRSVRERCFKVQEAAVKQRLHHFDVDQSKLEDVIHFVISLIKRDFPNPSHIPPHGRWRHFDVGGRPRIQTLINSWASLGEPPIEQTRRVLDLFVVSCLLDFEACPTWSYRERTTGRVHKRTEGLAVAVLDLFMAGGFSSDLSKPHRVDSEGLINLTLPTLLQAFQVESQNYLAGIEDRLCLLNHLGHVLQRNKDYFGSGTVPRPGNLMDYLLEHPTTIKTKKGPLIHLETIWPVVQEMGEFWAAEDNGKGGTLGLGDVWPCSAIKTSSNPQSTDHMVSFHRLSQWLVYSLIEPMQKLLGATIEGTDLLTPLPDYCNGGLLIDTGFISLKKADYERGITNYRINSLLPGQPKIEVTPMFDMCDPVVVEWRALTTAYLDLVAERVRDTLRLSRKSLSLGQLIEGGTWSAGRELAEISRPNTHEPPIVVKMEFRVIF
ncbi:hypothetical protein J3Q64DRAFT_1715674 [Phycomyces blakesleeanus]|uniref:Uncharacterized protein n=2 Tax=Phycomyces blakesleeanus TaxID=4837 RepID=A0A162YCD8_PHYB8|nr:hypothetical protein PHYBLDRAFT_179222 [Phycomyces blakesleeanus NRRL 1555(-)]OAD79725.1 hypothetical protein PHYBLDRAFT_179222 [Phycomyces blakesleeanus NRRL 1555(-)]|eukprot:XP_018297765.1 hypothetical protein PHYBLDRAFT_179222 [Phycomyces blakesleeanus NRRL 1555(-)]